MKPIIFIMDIVISLLFLTMTLNWIPGKIGTVRQPEPGSPIPHSGVQERTTMWTAESHSANTDSSALFH